jgi:hypothetical protein
MVMGEAVAKIIDGENCVALGGCMGDPRIFIREGGVDKL